MTAAAKPTTARKLCTICNLRPRATADQRKAQGMNSDMHYCVPCFEEAEWENTHSDNAHEQELTLANTLFTKQDELDKWLEERANEMDACWICQPELNQASAEYTPKAGHHSPRRKQINHKACQHPQTPIMRRKCRDQYHAGKGLLVVLPAQPASPTLTVVPAKGQGTTKATTAAPKKAAEKAAAPKK